MMNSFEIQWKASAKKEIKKILIEIEKLVIEVIRVRHRREAYKQFP
jgi:hypothetical protein